MSTPCVQPPATWWTSDGHSPSVPSRGMSTLPVVFVVGCERSGTTWVRSVFEAHPEALAPPRESQVWLLVSEVAALVADSAQWTVLLDRYDAGCAAPAGLHHWIARPALESLVKAAGDAGLPPEDAADQLAGRILAGYARDHWQGDLRVLVEKTPSHVFFAERIAGALPEARFVEVLRDGRDVCVSLQYRSRTKSWAPRDRRDQIGSWVRAVEAGSRARELPALAHRWHVLRYERMKADPRREIRALLSFAGLRHGDRLVSAIAEQTGFERYAVTGPDEHRRRGEVGDWRSHFDADDLALYRSLAGSVTEAAGYPLA